jgi:hypothetical protein
MKHIWILLIFSFGLLTSCGSFKYAEKGYVKIDKILTITSTGDTLAVPFRDFQKQNFRSFDTFQFRSFNWGYNYWGAPYGYYNYYHSPYFSYPRFQTYDFWYKPPVYNFKPITPMKGIRGSNLDIRKYPNPESKIVPRIDFNNNSNNNDQLKKFDIRSYGRPEIDNNGRGIRSRENIPTQPTESRFVAPRQPRQIYRGSQSSGIRQIESRDNSSQQGGRGIR